MTGCSYWLTKFTKKAVLAALALVAPAGPWPFCVRSLGFISLSLSRTAVNTDHYLTTVSEFSEKLTDHWVYDKVQSLDLSHCHHQILYCSKKIQI